MSWKDKLKKYVPPSSRTVNGRFSTIEQQIEELAALCKSGKNGNMGWNRALDGAQTLYYSCWANHIHSVHKESFGPFKGCHRGKDVVILATGPSAKYFEPFQPAVYIGVNHAYKIPGIELDYLFVQDFSPGHHNVDEIKKLSCVKFLGSHCRLPNSYGKAEAPVDYFQIDNSRQYYVNHVLGSTGNTPMHVDLEYFPLMDCWSTAFSAIEFAFYTHPARLFLVGCDTGSQLGGHFDGTPHLNQHREFEWMYKGYLQVRDFASNYYPDVEIISINSVRLKGLFNDCYTESFLKEFSEQINE